MTIIYVVLPLALLIVGGAVWAFVWAARSGQFDDLETPAIRMVHDEGPSPGKGARTSGGGASPANEP